MKKDPPEQPQVPTTRTCLVLHGGTGIPAATHSYLQNRGWVIQGTTSVRECILSVLSDKPDILLLSVDHADSKIYSVPKILKQSTTVKIIYFAEQTKLHSLNALAQSGWPYVLAARVSGPSFERLVIRMEKDIETEKKIQSQSEKRENMPPTPPRSSTASGFTTSETSHFITLKGSRPEDEMFLPPPTQAPSGSQASDGAARLTAFNTSQSSDSVQIIEGKGERFKGASLLEMATQEALKQVLKEGPETKPEVAPIGGAGPRLSCIYLASKAFCGYLVAASSREREFGAELLDLIRKELRSYLEQNNHPVHDEDLFELDLQEVPFEDWARKEGEFLEKAVHEGRPIALAFFPADEIGGGVFSSASINMIAVSIDEFGEEKQGDFPLFLYLPRNARYFNYTSAGGFLLDSQKARLKAYGIEEIHIKKQDFQGLKKFRAIGFLKGKIQEFLEDNPLISERSKAS